MLVGRGSGFLLCAPVILILASLYTLSSSQLSLSGKNLRAETVFNLFLNPSSLALCLVVAACWKFATCMVEKAFLFTEAPSKSA